MAAAPALSKADLEPLKALHRALSGTAPKGPKAKDARWVYERIKQLAPDEASNYLASRDGATASSAEAGPFAGAVMSTAQLQGAARTAVFAFVLEHGGECTSRLDARCTHLILREAAGAKYRFARHHGIHAVRPEFVAECVERGERVDESRFAVMSPAEKSATATSGSHGLAPAPAGPAQQRRAKIEPAHGQDMEQVSDAVQCAEFLSGTRAVIYVGDSFDSERAAVCKQVQQAGGQTVLEHSPEEKITHALCVHRGDAYFSSGLDGDSGDKYATAVNQLWWQACIDRQELLPIDGMKCYRPTGSSGCVRGMEKVSCTVTGFAGDKRKDIRNLLQLVGAQFSGAMQRGITTHLICAEPASGQKYEKAKQWGVKIVRVAWIQRVFEQWLHADESEFLPHLCSVELGVPAAPHIASQDAMAGKPNVTDLASQSSPASSMVVNSKKRRDRYDDTRPKASQDRRSRKKKKRRSQESQDDDTSDTIGSKQGSTRVEDEAAGTYRPCSEDGVGFFFLLSGGKSAQRQFISQIHAVDAKLQVNSAAACERAVVQIPREHGYDYRCTHLVMPELKRTHKFLCGVAGGVWVLQPSFLTAAEQCGSFSAVDPQEHEWYGAGVLQIPNSTGIWRPANRYWRRRAHREENPETPFIGLHVQILGSTRVEHHLLEDMIRMGGGQVLSQQSQHSDEDVPSELPRVSQEDDAQTVDVEQLHLGPTDVVVLGRYPKSKQQALLRRLQAAGVPCVKENWVIERICVNPEISRKRSVHHYKLSDEKESNAR